MVVGPRGTLRIRAPKFAEGRKTREKGPFQSGKKRNEDQERMKISGERDMKLKRSIRCQVNRVVKKDVKEGIHKDSRLS